MPGKLVIVLRLESVSQLDLPTLRSQFQTFIQATLPQALLAANPTTQATITVEKSSTYAETF